MQTNLEKEKLAYQSPLIGIYCISDDVVRTSPKDPYVDDGYDSGFNWGA